MSFTLVTGGAGFVGRPLVARLRAAGERVRVLDLAPPAHADDMQGSITDREAAARACDGAAFVFHLAGDAQLWARDPARFDAINRGGTETVLAAAREADVRRFVHCSSLTTLVGRKTPVGPSRADESIRLEPGEMLGAYPKSKLEAERAVEDAARAGLDAVIAIPTEPLGPGDESMTPPTRMIVDFLNGKTPAYIDCALNFVPVESLAEGLVAARDKGRAGERYLLAGETVGMRRLLDALEKISARKMPATRLPYWVALAAGAVDTGLVARLTGKPPKAPMTGVRLAGRRVDFIAEKAARDLGWRAAPFEPALAETVRWLTEKGFVR